MTETIFYNEAMIFLSVQGRGAILTLCIFLICVALVHVSKLALIGWRSYRKKEPKKTEKTEKTEPAEPVYYIVEKKKKTSPQYKKPRKFKFQK